MLRFRGTRRFYLLWAALVVVGSLVLAACGSDDDDGPSDEGSAAGDEEPVAGEEEPAGDEEEPAGGEEEPSDADASEVPAESASGGVLKYAPSLALSNLDPDLSNNGFDDEWLFPAYDRLVHLTPEAAFVPGLAESWELSDDGLTLTFSIRDGVVFHDGSSLSADVVLANLERSIGIEGSVNASSLAAVESVEVVDELTVQLNLVKPAASLIGTLSGRPGIMISGTALADEVDLSSTMVGAGMFTMTSYQAGDRAVFARFDDYWDSDSVRLDGLELVELLDPTARLNALRDGQIDATRVDPDAVATLEGEGFMIESGSTLEVWGVPFRLAEGEPWTDPLVREALTYGLDKQGILDVVRQGAGSVVSQFFPAGYFAASPNVPPDSRPFDPEKARQLLADAGYPDGFDLTVAVFTPDTTFIEAVQASWAAIGVNLEILRLEPSELAEKWFGGEFDMLPGPWTGRADPNTTNEALYSKDSTFVNFTGYDIPVINDLLARSEAATGEERTELLQDLAEAADEVAFAIPVYAADFIMASNDQVAGLEIYTTFKIEFRGVSVSE